MATTKKKRQLDQWRAGAIVAGILLLWFAIGNAHSVSVDFWLTTVHAPLIIVIAASAGLGYLITELARRAKKTR